MPMRTELALLRLLTWLSPAYPVGAYSHSHGLEWAVEAGRVASRADLARWLGTVLRHGGGWADAVLLAQAHAAVATGDDARWRRLRELAAALAPTAELALETRAQGAAFARISLASWPDDAGRLRSLMGEGPPLAYPLAVAAVAACHGVPLDLALPAYLHAVVANLVSAAVRLVPLGHTDGQRTLAELEPVVLDVATRAAHWPLEELGSAALALDLCSIHHETQYTRLFRT